MGWIEAARCVDPWNCGVGGASSGGGVLLISRSLSGFSSPAIQRETELPWANFTSEKKRDWTILHGVF